MCASTNCVHFCSGNGLFGDEQTAESIRLVVMHTLTYTNESSIEIKKSPPPPSKCIWKYRMQAISHFVLCVINDSIYVYLLPLAFYSSIVRQTERTILRWLIQRWMSWKMPNITTAASVVVGIIGDGNYRYDTRFNSFPKEKSCHIFI